MLRRVTLWAVTLCAIGCAHKYKTDLRIQTPGLLSPETAVYVSEPMPASPQYPMSGEQTAAAIRDAFERNGAHVDPGPPGEDAIAALASARIHNAKYLIFSAIEHWEDRATVWSGKPDRIEIKIHVVDTATGEPVDSTRLLGNSRSAARGGDQPQELLAKPIDDYVTSLFLGRRTGQ